MRLLLCATVSLLAGSLFGTPEKREIRMAEGGGKNRIQASAWTAWGRGFTRQGKILHCDNGTDAQAIRGAGQTIPLNQTEPRLITATAWSKSEDVGGGADTNYSLYLDLLYMDGTPQWGIKTAFDAGTHGWEKRTLHFMPEKPIRSVQVYVLFRKHTGRAWFRDVAFHEIIAPEGSYMFDGAPVSGPSAKSPGFRLRDVASGASVHTFDNGQALGVKLTSGAVVRDGVQFLEAEITDTTGKDRALTLFYTIPLPAGAWTWHHDLQSSQPIEGRGEFANTSHFAAGANGRVSRYPLCAITSENRSLALAFDPQFPAFARLVGNAVCRELFVAYDIALTPEQPTAKLRFCRYTADPRWGFRSALEKLYTIFPESFRCRIPRQGLWMPFARISKVEKWQDFGFRFKEGNNETAWDDAHDIITFRYTEPMTWWMKMPKEMPKTMEAARDFAQKLAAEDKGANGKHARALLASGYHNEKGQYPARIRDTPWCNGAVWSMNSMPEVPGEVTDFKLKWNPDLKETLYGAKRKGDLDGEYIDSSEGYVTDELNLRRDHFAAAQTPLVYTLNSRKPAIFRGLIAAEYARALATDVHGMDKLMMANSTPSRLWFLAPYLDVMGTETNWNRGSTWRPMSIQDLLFRRAVCGPKPFCFLQNTDFVKFPSDKVEKYMKRSLAFGMFPGFFSHNASQGHYFSRPEIYNRDRHLFKKYIPLCKLVAEAGWQPVTRARANEKDIVVERFGTDFLTVFNPSDKARTTFIQLETPGIRSATELISGKRIPANPRLLVQLGPEDVAVLKLQMKGTGN
ncbi:MAG: hypothetical protein KAI66_11930 [Lentisphaeria bacterium]|nr:hypothetical protein [Lentisphaeria bacterium]